MANSTSFLVNEQPRHRFSKLREIPETQLTMLVPKPLWGRLREYIQSYEAVTLAGRFGIDIRSADFWRGSLNVLRADIDRFVAMVDAGAA